LRLVLTHVPIENEKSAGSPVIRGIPHTERSTMTEYLYSPYPPLHYTVQSEIGPAGPGKWVEGDIPKWNLAWLSIPEIDNYVNNCGMKPGAILKSVDPKMFGTLMATAAAECDFIWVGLRDALTGPPDEFLKVFRTFDWTEMPPYKVNNNWPSIMITRLTSIRREDPRPVSDAEQREPMQATERQVTGNVIHATFGRPKAG